MNTFVPTDLRAAQELSKLLPSPVPLSPRPATADERPADDAVAVVATFVGQSSTELVVVVQEVVTEALAAAGDLSVAEAVRPALEAAAATLGTGVLGTAEIRPAGEVFSGPGITVHALEADGEVQGWFGLRAKGTTAPVGDPAAKKAYSAPLASGAMQVLYDVEMTLTAEIGRTRLPVRDVLELVPGSILELDRSAGAPADVMVNGRLVARGEVVVVDDEYAVRITEIVPATEKNG